MTTLLDELTERDPLDEYKGKWRNLWFKCSGGSKLCSEPYDTEKQAMAIINRVFEKLPDSDIFRFADGTDWKAHEVSHAIPMPAD